MALFVAIFIMGNVIPYEFLKFFGIFFTMPNGPVNVSSNWLSFVHHCSLHHCSLHVTPSDFLLPLEIFFIDFLIVFTACHKSFLVYGFFVSNQFVDAKVSIMRVNLNSNIFGSKIFIDQLCTIFFMSLRNRVLLFCDMYTSSNL